MEKKKKCDCCDDDYGTLYEEGSTSDIRYHEPAPERVLVRPKINFWLVALYIIATAAGGAGIYFGCYYLFEGLKNGGAIPADFNSFAIALTIAIVAFCVFLFIVRKRILIWFVHVYQRFASDDVRLRCVYTPSCSEYMILSIEKYGVIKGVYKGIKRLKRCHSPNGGEDYP